VNPVGRRVLENKFDYPKSSPFSSFSSVFSFSSFPMRENRSLINLFLYAARCVVSPLIENPTVFGQSMDSFFLVLFPFFFIEAADFSGTHFCL